MTTSKTRLGRKEQVTAKVGPEIRKAARERMWAEASILGPLGVDNESALVAFCLQRFAQGKVELK
jgi:hypothetical protein